MLNQDPKHITFRYGGTNSRELVCDHVEFGVELIGDVDEYLDFEMAEVYENVRLLIEMPVRLWLPDALWLLGYLQADDKYIHIDGHVIRVVNNIKKLRFKLWKKTNIAAHVTLKFKMKDVGMPDWAFGSGYLGIAGGTTE